MAVTTPAVDAEWMEMLMMGRTHGAGEPRLPGHPRREITPTRPRSSSKRYSYLTAAWIVCTVLATVAVVLLPRYVLDWDLAGQAPPSDRVKVINDIRTGLLQGLAGLGLLAGAVFAWRQLQLTRQGQAAERFTAAVTHIGDDNTDVRLGGIYALELLAASSTADRDAATDVLCAFVRRSAHVSKQAATSGEFDP